MKRIILSLLVIIATNSFGAFEEYGHIRIGTKVSNIELTEFSKIAQRNLGEHVFHFPLADDKETFISKTIDFSFNLLSFADTEKHQLFLSFKYEKFDDSNKYSAAYQSQLDVGVIGWYSLNGDQPFAAFGDDAEIINTRLTRDTEYEKREISLQYNYHINSNFKIGGYTSYIHTNLDEKFQTNAEEIFEGAPSGNNLQARESLESNFKGIAFGLQTGLSSEYVSFDLKGGLILYKIDTDYNGFQNSNNGADSYTESFSTGDSSHASGYEVEAALTFHPTSHVDISLKAGLRYFDKIPGISPSRNSDNDGEKITTIQYSSSMERYYGLEVGFRF